jgi:hypothetical protein
MPVEPLPTPEGSKKILECRAWGNERLLGGNRTPGCREPCERTVHATPPQSFDMGYSSVTHSLGLGLDDVSELGDIEDYEL